MSDSATPRTAACQAPLSMEYSRQECWSGLPFPSPGDLPNPGIKPRVSWIAGRLFTVRATREALTLLLRAFRTCVNSQMKGRCHQGNQRPPADTPCRDPLACTQWGALEPCALEKTLMLGKIEDEDELLGWHHQLNGHKFE